MNIKVKCGNWTGDTVSVRINQAKRTFTWSGQQYRLEPSGEGSFKILSGDHGWDQIGSVFKVGDGTWCATSAFSSLTRESTDGPYYPVIQLLENS